MKITEHLNTKQKAYSNYDNNRSNANYIDGFKPSARKIFYVTNDFKKLSKIDTIAQTTSLKTKYKHGAVSLEGVASGLAQTFTGTNLISIFKTKGFFGTRVNPYSGSSRYIEAMKNPQIDYVYRNEDIDVLINQEDEGTIIEPRFYVPILPTILLTSQSGIGNGYSQTIYSRNILDVSNYIYNFLDNKQNIELIPYFEGFKGKINKTQKNNQYSIQGCLDVINTTTIEITEIPINWNVEKYVKDVLKKLKNNKVIKSFKDKSHKNSILFEVKVPRELTKLEIDKIYDIFKLNSTITETLTTIDENNSIKVFDNIYDIIESYCNIRLEYYQKRKDFILNKMVDDLTVLQNKIRFIEDILDDKIIFKKKSKKDIEVQLEVLQYDNIDDKFDYLLNMNFFSLTNERLEDLKKQFNKLEKEMVIYKKKSIKTIWKSEIKELLKVLNLDINEPKRKDSSACKEKILNNTEKSKQRLSLSNNKKQPINKRSLF